MALLFFLIIVFCLKKTTTYNMYVQKHNNTHTKYHICIDLFHFQC